MCVSWVNDTGVDGQIKKKGKEGGWSDWPGWLAPGQHHTQTYMYIYSTLRLRACSLLTARSGCCARACTCPKNSCFPSFPSSPHPRFHSTANVCFFWGGFWCGVVLFLLKIVWWKTHTGKMGMSELPPIFSFSLSPPPPPPLKRE